ncbi:hypothetical protein CEUSTIGMA_g7730.t1 [Chlamydomonas eustigma]|uniref:Uncharacterized protein n=1 Tax=Chlamydomonas eustigma TaxID=1157962 RepID=A0A250XBP2_9CHLO|nr:hypothetical protein CEUSTIGMA_g7730.t1 [Chlamydomonas eustigma]|eukprot:GAX80292.1 hypothetical protein CEUSTIGMA_g7730.t1 [Chlamydomonas eustigma]
MSVEYFEGQSLPVLSALKLRAASAHPRNLTSCSLEREKLPSFWRVLLSCKRLEIVETSRLLMSDEEVFKQTTAASAAGASSAQSARLKLVISIFRDAGRTPLTERYIEPAASHWPFCHTINWPVTLKVQTMQSRKTEKQVNALSQKPLTKKKNTHKELMGGCRLGAITDVGHGQARAYGRLLRNRYFNKERPKTFLLKDILPASLPSHLLLQSVLSYSTNHNRSLSTLQSVLHGLLFGGDASSSSGISITSESSSSSPVVETLLHVRTEDNEILYGNVPGLPGCKALGLLMTKAENDLKGSGTGQDDMEGSRDAAVGLRMFLRLPSRDASGWISWKRLLDAIMCLELHNKTLYQGLSNHLYKTIDREATTRVSAVLGPKCSPISSQCQSILRLSTGLLLAELSSVLHQSAGCNAVTGSQADDEFIIAGRSAEVMVVGSSNSSTTAADGRNRLSDTATITGPAVACSAAAAVQAASPRLLLFSAHDSTLLALLAVLGHSQSSWPPFMSDILIELWEYDGPTHDGKPTSSDNAAQPSATGSGSYLQMRHFVRVLYNMEELNVAVQADRPVTSQAATKRKVLKDEEKRQSLMSLEEFTSKVLSHFVVSNVTAYQVACNELTQQQGGGLAGAAAGGEGEIITVGKVIGTYL